MAANVAARGLDIPEVDLVIQSSPPQDVESYIHRSGRTGRAGRTGICICFYQPRERGQLRYVEQKAVSRVKLFQAYYLNGALEKRSFCILTIRSL